MKVAVCAGAATLLTVVAIVTFVHAEAQNTSYDSRFYLLTTEAFRSGNLMVPASVPSPFRYRILAPWLAGHLPLPSSDALPLMTYLSLGLTYFVTLLLCAQLGIGTFPAIVGLAAAYASPAHLGLYFNAFMTDAFGLLLITVMMLALAADAVWAFGITAVFAPLAREVALFILPVWCLRSWRRGLVIALLAVVVFGAARWMIGPGLPGPIAGTGPEGPEPTMIGALRFFTSYRLQHLDYLALDLRNLLMSWGWVWLSAAAGLALVRANQVQIVACAGALMLGAFATVAVAGDVLRLFGVLFPIMAIGTGQIVDTMIERKQRVWLGFFIALVVLQFFLTAPHLVRWTHVWSGLAPHINILRIGFAGVLVGVFIIRHDVMGGVRQTAAAIRFGN